MRFLVFCFLTAQLGLIIWFEYNGKYWFFLVLLVILGDIDANSQLEVFSKNMEEGRSKDWDLGESGFGCEGHVEKMTKYKRKKPIMKVKRKTKYRKVNH